MGTLPAGIAGLLAISLSVLLSSCVHAQKSSRNTPRTTTISSSDKELAQPWLEPIPICADPELEAQIQEVQNALTAIGKEMVRHKDALNKAQDPTANSKLADEVEALRKERKELEALLHDLVDEAKLSEQTAIDEALARARWLERQQEYYDKKEESIRDRQN